MHRTVLYYRIDQINQVANQLLAQRSCCFQFALEGTLGAGKTTLAQAMLAQLGITGHVMSPTFSYVNIYNAADGTTVYHFDLYRLRSLDDFIALGFDEYLADPYALCLIEWPEIIMPLLQSRVCFVTIEYHEQNERKLTYWCQP